VGPYSAEVERVVDGDTLAVRVAIWIGQDLNVLVRIRGIDAPETRGNCESEKEQARQATLALQRLIASGNVALTTIEGDKYFGRVIADVATASAEDVAAALVSSGFVRAYDGGTRQSWCDADRSDQALEVTGSVGSSAD
jgi:endonuclease YncB( thermonuclease family)